MSMVNINELCRLCLVKDTVVLPIFESDLGSGQLYLKIRSCLPVKVEPGDKLPQKICQECGYKVELLYQFVKTSVGAEKQLLNWLGQVGELEDKQGYATEVLDSSVLKQEGTVDSRLDGSVMQVTGPSNLDINLIDNMSIITMADGSEQQFTTVPIDGSVQTVQIVTGTSADDQIVQSQVEEEEDEEEDNYDDGCDNDDSMAVKEETEEVLSERTLEPAFVSLPCDEAGPSGLQHKIPDISEMSSQTADDDPKPGLKRERMRVPTILQRKKRESIEPKLTLEQFKQRTPGLFPPVKRPVHTVLVSKAAAKASPKASPKAKAPSAKPARAKVEESGENRCDSCDECFDSQSGLIIHKTEKSIVRTRIALREPMVKHTCDLCNRQFSVKSFYLRHFKNCGVLELESLPNAFRKRRVRSASASRAARDGETGEELPAKCDKCDKVFKKQKYLRVHKTLAHDEHVSCQLCDAELSSNAELKNHMSDKHAGDYTEFCSICHKGFYLVHSLKVHMAAHARDDRPCICEICGKSFRHEVYLGKHVQAVHVEMREPKKYKCEQCSYETTLKSCYREHTYKHTGEDVMECHICSKRMRRSYFKIHMRIHSGEKPEICEFCGKGFTARKYLKKHLITHTGEKPYQCEICAKSYTQRGTLVKHFRKHHPEQTAATKWQIAAAIKAQKVEEARSKWSSAQLQSIDEDAVVEVVNVVNVVNVGNVGNVAENVEIVSEQYEVLETLEEVLKEPEEEEEEELLHEEGEIVAEEGEIMAEQIEDMQEDLEAEEMVSRSGRDDEVVVEQSGDDTVMFVASEVAVDLDHEVVEETLDS